MKFIITGRNFEITRAHRTYIRKRFSKWSNFLNAGSIVHVILYVEGYRQIAEVTSKDKHYTINGKQTTKDLYQSIDLLAEKINRQLAKQHDKLINKDAAMRSKDKRNITSLQSSASSKNEQKEPELIVGSVRGKPMSTEEAILQLQSVRKNYIVYMDAETGQLAVLTKEKNNKMKLIINE